MKREIVATVCIIFVFCNSAYTEQELLGDKSDGSRATPLHLIPLYAENEAGEKGELIDPNAIELLPFSTRFSCGECHSHGTIQQGWHFNAVDSNTVPGRAGEPWIYFDQKLGIQIPLSYRRWPGTFSPQEFSLSAFQFTKIFGRHFPGGGPGEVKATEFAEIARQFISGKLEINCLACHNVHYGQDMGSVGGHAIQVSRENYRWASAASCEFASVTGSAANMSDAWDPWMPDPDTKGMPIVTYQKEAFNENNEVLLQIVREVPNERCYYCHSDLYYSHTEEADKWSSDEDVHLTAGLKCVDCHRNGLDHNIIRGYDLETGISNNPLAATSSCEGCHLGEGNSRPQAGRLGAPVPTHPGIPTIHFEKLTCTACHSGPWPDGQTVLTKTSRAHRLGTPDINKAKEILPHIISPVFARQSGIIGGYLGKAFLLRNDKIAPHKMIWPAYWGRLVDNQVKLIGLDIINKTVGNVFKDIELTFTGDWPVITKEKITEALKALSAAVNGTAVYIAGGTLYKLDETGGLSEEADHPAAAPYMWPIAHNVRPAAQSLGVRRCEDCHATDSPFFFGKVAVDTPVDSERDSLRAMVEFQEANAFYTWAFAFSFIFRSWLKVVTLACCTLIAAVLLLYALKALACVVRVLAGRD